MKSNSCASLDKNVVDSVQSSSLSDTRMYSLSLKHHSGVELHNEAIIVSNNPEVESM